VTSEAAAIAALRASLPPPPPGEIWIGDDMAVLRSTDAPWLLMSADTVVAGVHADLTLTSIEDFGWKAMTSNLSDVAAMGADPGHALVTVAGPEGCDLDGLYRGIIAAASCYDCPVVGGDLSAADVLVVTVAVTATADGAPVARAGARPGDGIWITCSLGAAAAGLRSWQQGDRSGLTAVDRALRAAHARPRPRLAEGRAARIGGASAMIDVSDGFAGDLGHLADASGVGFDVSDVPVADGATLEDALGGGEDYELVFCAPDGERIRSAFEGLEAPRRLGTCLADPTTRVLNGRPLVPAGWQHRL
jgi:thiamine-monophosphate kinase